VGGRAVAKKGRSTACKGEKHKLRQMGGRKEKIIIKGRKNRGEGEKEG